MKFNLKEFKNFLKDNWSNLDFDSISKANPSLNHVWQNNQYIIKIHNYHKELINEVRIKKLSKIYKKFSNQSILLTNPIINSKKKYISFYKNIMPVVVYRKVLGNFCTTSLSDMKFAFETVALFHKFGKKINLSIKELYREPFISSVNILLAAKEIKNIKNKEIYWLMDFCYKFINENKKILTNLSKGLIHGDFSYKHILRCSNKIRGVIDLEYFNIGYLITDIDRVIDDYRELNILEYKNLKNICLDVYLRNNSLNKYDLEFINKARILRLLQRAVIIANKIINGFQKKDDYLILNKDISEIKNLINI